MNDPFDLQRFVDAQNAGGTYERALNELKAGRKTSHWMWFVFPQIAGLGSSPMAQRFAISSISEAREYLAHPILGERLKECVHALLNLQEHNPVRILGSIDAQKLRSSMTLFKHSVQTETCFATVLERYYEGIEDPATVDRLSS